MVNTFLTNENFAVSARSMDKVRLNRQIAEAFQILKIINKYYQIAEIFKIPLPPKEQETTKEYRDQWIRHVFSFVKNFSYIHYSVHYQRWIFSPIGTPIPQNILESDQLVYNEDIVYVYDKKKKTPTLKSYGYISHYVLPDDIFIHNNMRHRFHPAVVMWIGFEEALKDYIDAHINEWIIRGGKGEKHAKRIRENNKYTSIRPKWTYDKEFMKVHAARLIDKEINRKETPWYVYQKFFIDSWVKDANKEEFVKFIKQQRNENFKILSLQDKDFDIRENVGTCINQFTIERYILVLKHFGSSKKSIVNWWANYDENSIKILISNGTYYEYIWP